MTTSVAKVIGENTRTLRIEAKVTAERFAAAASSVGLPWTTGRVGDFEHGRMTADLATIYAASVALGRIIGRPVTLAELLATDSPVDINDTLTIGPGALLGQVVPAGPSGHGGLSATAVPLLVLESDHRLCRDLGVDRDTGVKAMVSLWGHTFSAERDRRAGEGANPQKRGIVARRLKAELRAELERAN